MKRTKQISYFLLIAVVRLVLYLIGWVAVAFSVLGKGYRHTPKMWRMWAAAEHDEYDGWTRWQVYKYWAFRNPTPGLIGKWTQPVPEPHPNPDHTVRVQNWPKDSRWLEHGLYWEYWYLWQISVGKYKWFEFRIGWKFVDGNDEFFPTLQFGPRSS